MSNTTKKTKKNAMTSEAKLRRDALLWRAIYPHLSVAHWYWPGRIGFGPTFTAQIEVDEDVTIETPGDGTHGPTFTVREVVTSIARKQRTTTHPRSEPT